MNTMRRLGIACCLGSVICLLAASSLQAAHWPQWRGPNGNGVAEPGEYPVEFSADKGVLWKVELPGKGCSTPVIWEERIFLTCAIENKDGVLCYDRTGKELWRQTFGPAPEAKHESGSGCNPSAVVDGERVYVHYKSGTFACVDFTGKVVWQKNLQALYGEIKFVWDLGTSPVRAGENVILAVMNAGPSYLLCVEGATGKVVWKQPRQFDCAFECNETYSTPVLTKVGEREILVSWGADRVMGHDVTTGQPIWECNLNPGKEKMWRTISSPAVANGMAVVSYARGRRLAGVKVNGSGKVEPAWQRQQFGTDTPTPATLDGKAYVLNDKGKLACLDVQTGEDIWTAQLPSSKGAFFASPVLAGNRLYCIHNSGAVVVGKIADDNSFTVLAENKMGEPMVATPVLVDGRLYLRGDKHLFCIGN